MEEKSTAKRIERVQELIGLERHDLEIVTKEELIEMVGVLSQELVDYLDLTCGPETAARVFSRKRSWIYEAMSRPRTVLQKDLASSVVRERGGLLFRFSDLVRIRRKLFEGEGI